jgi:hypothetical protein
MGNDPISGKEAKDVEEKMPGNRTKTSKPASRGDSDE